MSYAKSFTCLAIATLLLGGCAVFGSKTTDEKLESEIAALMLDQQILETRLSLAEDRVTALQVQINEVQEGGPAGSDAAQTEAKPAKQSQTQPAQKSSASGAELAYKNALDTFMARNYRQSEKLFKDFMKKYPSSALMPNAGYWLGESYYAQARYDEAIINFQSVVGRYPRHHKAADSLLKTGYSYSRLGDKENARFYLGQVGENYPDTRAASLAAALLSQLN